MSEERNISVPPSGRFSPLRYPGGKGKLARFVAEVVRLNRLHDGLYVEPYAGGAAIAWELLLTGLVRRVHVNDLSRPVFAFWRSLLERTDDLCRLVRDTPVNLNTWDRMKAIFSNSAEVDNLQLGFAMFYLNRTNRSGILNGGPIGGRAQASTWNIDARFNRPDLIARIERIARVRSRITLTNMDAATLLTNFAKEWSKRTLVYLDPPYYNKARELYYDYYQPKDHSGVAEAVRSVVDASWIVSYDDVSPIHALYSSDSWLQYQIGYSARNRTQGREAMFFSPGLTIPEVRGSMVEVDRWPSTPTESYRPPCREAA